MSTIDSVSFGDRSAETLILYDLTDESNENESAQRITTNGERLGQTSGPGQTPSQGEEEEARVPEAEAEGNRAAADRAARESLISTPPPPYPGVPGPPYPSAPTSVEMEDRNQRSLAPSPPSVRLVWIQQPLAPSGSNHINGVGLCFVL